MREGVKEAIRQALHDRRFQPGESLSEAGLAVEMGVSRGPVREALFQLVQEGLVTHSPNRGFSVILFTARDLQEIQVVRLPLETAALELARGRISAAETKKLKDLKVAMVQSLAENQFVPCGQSDMTFHSLIWEISGNAKLSATLRNLMAPFFAYGSVFRTSRGDLTPNLLDEQHESYIRFLTDSGDQTAEACVRFHLGM